MWGEKKTRDLLGLADPARLAVIPARRPAAELIARSEARPDEPAGRAGLRPEPAPRPQPAPRRRLLVAGALGVAVAAVAVAAAAVLHPFSGSEPAVDEHPRPAALPLVVVPLAYEVETDPEPARDHLLVVAAGIMPASHDGQSGEFAHHFVRTWGGAVLTSPEGHSLSYTEEWETWAAADGSGVQRRVEIAAQFPDDESRRYWEAVPNSELLEFPNESVSGLTPGMLHAGGEVPSDRATLEALFSDDRGGFDVKAVERFYHEWVVPVEVRALALEVLAEVPGAEWRGEVTDRADRPGVAISVDLEQQTRSTLVFDADTGELLSVEATNLADETVGYYSLLLETGWADEPGASPAG